MKSEFYITKWEFVFNTIYYTLIKIFYTQTIVINNSRLYTVYYKYLLYKEIVLYYIKIIYILNLPII